MQSTDVRADGMMNNLMTALENGTDIGHYGRLVFCMVGRHFMDEETMLGWLTKDPDFSEEQARVMMRQVGARGYNPPKRERILEWQAQQDFKFLDADDPDQGNVYRTLKFPDEVYGHIEQYQEQKMEAGEAA